MLTVGFISDNLDLGNHIKDSKTKETIQNQFQIKDKEIKKKNNFNDENGNIDENHLKEKKNNSLLAISSFRQFVDLFYIKREAILHTQLYNSIKLNDSYSHYTNIVYLLIISYP